MPDFGNSWWRNDNAASEVPSPAPVESDPVEEPTVEADVEDVSGSEAPVFDASPVGSAESSETTPTGDAVDAEAEAPETGTESAAAGSSAGSAHASSRKNSRRGGRKGGKGAERKAFPHVDAAVAAKVGGMLDALRDAQAVSVVKLLCNTSKSDPAQLVDLLTDSRNRKTVSAVADLAERLTAADEGALQATALYAFVSDKTIAKTLFGVLNVVAPERGFGRASNDPWQDSKTVGDKWGDGVDLGMVSKFRV